MLLTAGVHPNMERAENLNNLLPRGIASYSVTTSFDGEQMFFAPYPLSNYVRPTAGCIILGASKLVNFIRVKNQVIISSYDGTGGYDNAYFIVPASMEFMFHDVSSMHDDRRRVPFLELLNQEFAVYEYYTASGPVENLIFARDDP
jgi:hypothetical protein